MGGGFTKSKLIDAIKSTVGYDGNYRRDSQDWQDDNPFTTTTSFAPLTTETDKMTHTQSAMLEVFQYISSSTLKPISYVMSTILPSSSVSYNTDKDEWGNNVESYRVDEPPHTPGLSLECRKVLTFYASMHLLFADTVLFYFSNFPQICYFVPNYKCR